MANQPTKYSKFLVGAASAALVATAVAPVASAADFKDTKGNTHEDAINALVKAEIANGYKDGSFKPNKELTRADVVKFLGKWLVTQGKEIPSDAVTNPRFKDLKTTSEKELLEYAAVAYDNGVFNGSNGNLLPSDKMTRQNMANVIVRAFDNVKGIELVKYVESQKDFKGDVKDLSAAYEDTRGAITVVDFFDITDPNVANFRPKDPTTRGQFASFLNRALNTDFSAVTGAVYGSIKAINATTVEVTFEEDVKDVKTSDYTIDGLAISNAAVKQTNSKVVVLTTAVQTGDKEYTVKSGDKTLGTFKGISAVIPTKITMNTTSTQGVVGKEVTLKADIGVKEAGVAVTFNVKADDKLNKDQVVEAVTNAEGIATYSYTQYAAGNDDVTVYPTGAPAVRSLAKVYWGVDSILTIVTDDKKGDEINNGENKVYKVTYKDPKSGKAVANQKLNVTFAENVDTTIDKITHATVNGKNPSQLTNGKTEAVTVTTNSNGEATLTVSGLNTKATPVVFLDDAVNNRVAGNNRLEATELQAKAIQLVIGAVQSSYVLDVVRDGKEEAATGLDNGRKYKVTVKTKDGKVAANETVNVSFNEVLDRNMNTKTSAIFTKSGVKHPEATNNDQQLSVKLNAKGEGSFTIASNNEKDYATPVVWIDINSSNAKSGTLDEGEPSKVADITYFAKEELTDGNVKAYDAAGKEIDEDEKYDGDKTAYFKFTAANQSGNEMPLPAGYDHIDASFTVFNDGSNDVKVYDSKGKLVDIVSPKRSLSVTVNDNNNATPTISVKSDDKTTDVRVEARGTAIPTNYRNNNNNNWNNNNNRNWNNNSTVNLGSHTAKVSFVSTKDIGVIHTGIVESIDTVDKDIKFVNKDKMSYKGASFKNVNAVSLTQGEFESLVKANEGTAKVTVKKDSDDKVTFEIVSLNPAVSGVLETINAATTTTTDTAKVVTALDKAGFAPPFSVLKDDQKTAIAQAVIAGRTSGGVTVYTENRLKEVYSAAYDVQVTVAVAAVNAALVDADLVTALNRVPGLDLKAYNAIAVKTDVNALLIAGNYADLAALQAGIAEAIRSAANAPALAGLNAVNTATSADSVKAALDSHATALGFTSYEGLDKEVKAGVATYLFNKRQTSSFNSASLAQAYTKAVDAAQNAPKLKTAVINAEGTTLTLTFSQDVESTGFDLSLNTGSVATDIGTVNNSVEETIVITLKPLHGVNVGDQINTVNVKNLAGKAIVDPNVNVKITK